MPGDERVRDVECQEKGSGKLGPCTREIVITQSLHCLSIIPLLESWGNSLVYGIDVAEFSAYMLNYQHCYFYWTICAGKSA